MRSIQREMAMGQKTRPSKPTSTPIGGEATLDPEAVLTLARIQAEVTNVYVHALPVRVTPANPTLRPPTYVEAASRVSPNGRAIQR